MGYFFTARQVTRRQSWMPLLNLSLVWTALTPITPTLHDVLHWLPVEHRIQYKITLLVYNSLHSTAPKYLSEHYMTLVNNGSRNQLHYCLRWSCGAQNSLNPGVSLRQGLQSKTVFLFCASDIPLLSYQFKQHLKCFFFRIGHNIF